MDKEKGLLNGKFIFKTPDQTKVTCLPVTVDLNCTITGVLNITSIQTHG